MKYFKFGNKYIPENAIQSITITPAGKNAKYEEVVEFCINTAGGQQFLPLMSQAAADIILKTSFGAAIQNISSTTSVDDDYVELMRQTGA